MMNTNRSNEANYEYVQAIIKKDLIKNGATNVITEYRIGKQRVDLAILDGEKIVAVVEIRHGGIYNRAGVVRDINRFRRIETTNASIANYLLADVRNGKAYFYDVTDLVLSNLVDITEHIDAMENSGGKKSSEIKEYIYEQSKATTDTKGKAKGIPFLVVLLFLIAIGVCDAIGIYTLNTLRMILLGLIVFIALFDRIDEIRIKDMLHIKTIQAVDRKS